MPENRRYRINIINSASEEIVDLHDFYEEWESGWGDLFLDNLGVCLARLEENPREWQYAKTRAEKVRRGIVPKPQVIFLYVIEDNEVRILAVKDARSDWLSKI